MSDQPTAAPNKPQGFSRWVGRGLAVVLLLLAVGIGLTVVLDGGSPTTARPNAGPSQGIHFN